VEEGLRPDWGKGAILGVPMGGCFSQEEHRLQSRPAEAAGPDGLKKSKSDSKAIASAFAAAFQHPNGKIKAKKWC